MKRRDHRRWIAAALLWAGTGAVALAAPGNLQWTTTVAHADEDGGLVQMVVERVGGSEGAVSIDYATFNLEAIAGSDYESVSGTLQWADGQGGARSVDIPILDDAVPELEERLGALLTNPSGGAVIAGSAYFIGIVHDDDGPPPGGRLQWSSTVMIDDEDAGVFVFTVERVEASAGAVSIDYGSVNVEAIAGEDYTTVAGTLNWEDGDSTSRTIEVPVTDDTEIELQERFALILDNPVGDMQLLGSAQAVGYIEDNDGAPSGGRLQWSTTVVEVDEGIGVAVLTVERVEASSGAVGVAYASVNVEAVEEDDYLPVSGTLSWADGETAAQTIEVPIVDDDTVELSERLAVLFGETTGDVQITGSAQAVVYIEDDDAASTGLLRFEQGTHSIGEDAGSIQLTVLREGGTAGEIGVSYATDSGDAGPGSDYTGVNGTLTWLDGDATPRTIVVPVLDDDAQEPDESFDVVLSQPTGGAALGSPSFTRITLVDDGDLPPPAGTLAFDPHIYPALEHDGVVQLIVTRSGGDAGALSVEYATVAMTAAAGEDFVAASGTLDWPPGDTDPRFITVSVLDDAVAEPGETFRVELSAPTGGAVLGEQSAAFVQIGDDDEAPAALFRDGFE